MVKPRYFLFFIILNVGLLLIYAISSDYKNTADTVNQFDIKMQSIVDASLDEVMVSEELFLDSSKVFTSSSKHLASNVDTFGKVPIYSDACNKEMVNMYAVAMFYDNKGRLPKTVTEVSSFLSDDLNFFKSIYGWTFGNVDTRIPTTSFKRYYDVVGKDIKVKADMPIKDISTGDITIGNESISVLDQMGLQLSAYNTDAKYTAETLKNVQKEGHNNSIYYLTPYSLGVTYVNPTLLKVCLMSNIEDSFRLDYWSGTGEPPKSQLRKASGCIISQIADAGSSTKKQLHTSSGTTGQIYSALDSEGNAYNSNYINNGLVEVDMNSLDVDVDYATVDFYDNKNADLVTFIEGFAGTRAERSKYPEDVLKVKETRGMSGNRIVARVTVSMNINIPFTSEFSQYYKYKNPGTHEHLGIDGFTYDSITKDSIAYDPNSGGDVRYEYTTYVALSR